MIYRWIARSDSDPNGDKGGLGFNSTREAATHAARMNELRKEYPTGWNTDFWKAVPAPWNVYEATK